jgi:serine/threonine protein kinase
MERYHIISVAGEGSYGVVLKARDSKTKELVAIKQFKGPEDESSVREYKILALLSHRNIIGMVSMFTVI